MSRNNDGLNPRNPDVQDKSAGLEMILWNNMKRMREYYTHYHYSQYRR